MKKVLLFLAVCYIIIIGLFVSFKIYASETTEFTYLGTLQSNQIKSKSFNLGKGINIITLVSDDSNALFTCSFHSNDDLINNNQSKVSSCNAKIETKSDITVSLKFKNEIDKTIDYVIHINNQKGKSK